MSETPTTLKARAQLWNGSAWIDAPGDATNGIDVDVTRSVLPTGASTEATLAGVKTGTDKLPTLVSGRTPVDGAGGTFPVTGTFFQATQPVSAAALPLPSGASTSAAQTDGTQKAISRGGAKGSTAAADVTSTAEGADHQAQDVQIYHGGTAKDPTAIRPLTAADVVTADTELPPAAALADSAANPTAPGVGAHGLIFNGTSWDRAYSASSRSDGSTGAGMLAVPTYVWNGVSFDRARGDAANGADVDVTRVQAGDVDHDAVNTAKVHQVGGHAVSEKAPVAEPSAVSAGDRVRAWHGLRGETVVRNRTVPTYSAVGRLAAVNARGALSFSQVANTDKQWLALWHAATAAKLVRIRYVGFQLVDVAVATILDFDVRLITGAPATGNPAITPAPHNVDNPATECSCLALPGTAGTMAATPSFAMQEFDSGILAPPTAPPGANVGRFDLYREGDTGEDEQPIELRPGALEGIAIVVRAVTAGAVTGIPIIRYTEETP